MAFRFNPFTATFDIVEALVHTLLDGLTHTDTAAASPTRGAIIVGNSTPKWDKVSVGAANTVVRTDGTDTTFGKVALATDVSGDLPFANFVPATAGSKLVGRRSGSSGDFEEIAVGSGLTMSSVTLSADATGTNTGDQLVFKTISVSGQSDVVADSATDTLTLAAGSNITITTNASTDTITIASTGSGSGLKQDFQGLQLRTDPDNTVALTTIRVVGLTQWTADDGTLVADTLTNNTAVITSGGAGGLDTGSEAASTWYEIYRIRKSSNGTLNTLLHRSKDYLLDQQQTTDNDSFGLRSGATTTVRVGQSFVPSITGSLQFIDVKLNQQGIVSGNIWWTIEADSSSTPSGTPLATSDKIDASLVSATSHIIRFIFRTPATLTGSTTYWLVAYGDYTASSSNRIRIRANSAGGYASGTASQFDGTTWSVATDYDVWFKTYSVENDTAVTMPAGYDQKCLLGFVYNDSGSDFDGFLQQEHEYSRLVADYTVSAGTAIIQTLTDISITVPPRAVIVSVVDVTNSAAGVAVYAQGILGNGYLAGMWFSSGANYEQMVGFTVPIEYQYMYYRVPSGTAYIGLRSFRW